MFKLVDKKLFLLRFGVFLDFLCSNIIHFSPYIGEKTTGKSIKWIICFSPVLLNVFFDKIFTK